MVIILLGWWRKSFERKNRELSHQEFNLKIIKRNIKRNLSMGRDVFYRLGEKRNKILEINSSKIIDKAMSDIILNYRNLIILKE